LDPAGKQNLLSGLPSVDELLKTPEGSQWLSIHGRRIVLEAVRDVIASRRTEILEGLRTDPVVNLAADIKKRIGILSSYSLTPVINATGIVLHTNLGRSVLSDKVLEHVREVGTGYSTLEYDLRAGKRGQRHTHTRRLLQQITGAEDALIVNNNAAAVLICLNTLAGGKEVIVSRGELVEIGGSFRIPDVMKASGVKLCEVGTTNKTHLYDYTNAVNENTALILKVHQSNYKIVGFTEDVRISDLVSLGREERVPVMYDLGSGCLVDLRKYGIHGEPSVQEIVRSGVDVVTFSGDKLLGGPQGGIIAGKEEYIERIRKNPLARALRIDKLTIAAFEATLMGYMDEENAALEIPVLRMLFQSHEEIRERARKIAAALRAVVRDERFDVIKDSSRAGGGSLPEVDFPSFAVSVKPRGMSVNEMESQLRKGSPPVIARIKGDSLLLDARTIRKSDIKGIVRAVSSALSSAQPDKP
jgi:L-seryl-tRNA(Ser) seleniumtransferase